MQKKYGFTGKRKVYCFSRLKQIVALRDFGDVKKGDIGGWIQNQNNLDHEGDCWVTKDGIIRNNAKVTDNAIIDHEAVISDSAMVRHDAVISGNATLSGYSVAKHRCKVYGRAAITDKAIVADDCEVLGITNVGGLACVAGAAKIDGGYFSNISGKTTICGYTELSGKFNIQNAYILNSPDDKPLDLYPIVLVDTEYFVTIVANRICINSRYPYPIKEFLSMDDYNYDIKDPKTLNPRLKESSDNDNLIKAKRFWTSYKRLIEEYEQEKNVD